MTTEIELKAEIGKFIASISERYYNYFFNTIETETFYIEFIRYLKEKAEIRFEVTNIIRDNYIKLCETVLDEQKKHNIIAMIPAYDLYLGKKEINILEEYFGKQFYNDSNVFFGLRINKCNELSIIKVS